MDNCSMSSAIEGRHQGRARTKEGFPFERRDLRSICLLRRSQEGLW